MNRNDQFEKNKIYKASTNKVVTNVYFDSFGIEKVRFQNAEYASKKSISIYLDFSQALLLAEDARSGRLFSMIERAENGQYTVTMGGTKSSKDLGGKPESRVMTLGLMKDKIFINMRSGYGKLSQTGLIIPDGKPLKNISVGMSLDDFRRMMLITTSYINAYLSKVVPRMVAEAEQDYLDSTR